ncbi:MAG TPA: hypothetical protein VHQ43_01245 [Solirubrobacterales bacterium]|nr:hypothetical protein [Solirubrobacterales bacterium]
MSDGGAHFDWDGVFDRAHRRLYIRLTLLCVVSGLLALLLLGGGLSARGDITWRIGPFASKASKTKKDGQVRVAKHVEESLGPSPIASPSSAPPSNPPPKKNPSPGPVIPPPPPPIPPPPPDPGPCPDGDSSDRQYEDCVPQPTPADTDNGTDITPSTKTTTNGGIEYEEEATPGSGLSTAAPEGAASG